MKIQIELSTSEINGKHYLNVAKYALIVGKTPTAVYYDIKQSKVNCLSIGNQKLVEITEAQIEEFVANHKE